MSTSKQTAGAGVQGAAVVATAASGESFRPPSSEATCRCQQRRADEDGTNEEAYRERMPSA